METKDERIKRLERALGVIVLCAPTVEWLKDHDPKALEQAVEAVRNATSPDIAQMVQSHHPLPARSFEVVVRVEVHGFPTLPSPLLQERVIEEILCQGVGVEHIRYLWARCREINPFDPDDASVETTKKRS